MDYKKLISDPKFRKNIEPLGKFEYHDESGDPIIFTYWTDMRWKFFENRKHGSGEARTCILSPAFWKDKELEARFALDYDEVFHLQVYVKKKGKESIIGKIGCYKTIVEYSEDLKPSSPSPIKLSCKEELLATIQNLDHFFTEKVPFFMSFDHNIVFQALQMLIENGLASNELLVARCNQIKDIVRNLFDSYKTSNLNSQLYFQIKSLLDFNPKDWVLDFMYSYDLYSYFREIVKIEGEEARHKILKALSIVSREYLEDRLEIEKDEIGKELILTELENKKDFDRIKKDLINIMMKKVESIHKINDFILFAAVHPGCNHFCGISSKLNRAFSINEKIYFNALDPIEDHVKKVHVENGQKLDLVAAKKAFIHVFTECVESFHNKNDLTSSLFQNPGCNHPCGWSELVMEVLFKHNVYGGLETLFHEIIRQRQELEYMDSLKNGIYEFEELKKYFMACPKCGQQIPIDSKFCKECGHEFLENKTS